MLSQYRNPFDGYDLYPSLDIILEVPAHRISADCTLPLVHSIFQTPSS